MFLAYMLHCRDIEGQENKPSSNLVLQHRLSRANMSYVSLLSPYVFPPIYSLFQLLHSLMSGTDLKIYPFFLLSVLVEGEGATILCWTKEPAVGGC